MKWSVEKGVEGEWSGRESGVVKAEDDLWETVINEKKKINKIGEQNEEKKITTTTTTTTTTTITTTATTTTTTTTTTKTILFLAFPLGHKGYINLFLPFTFHFHVNYHTLHYLPLYLTIHSLGLPLFITYFIFLYFSFLIPPPTSLHFVSPFLFSP